MRRERIILQVETEMIRQINEVARSFEHIGSFSCQNGSRQDSVRTEYILLCNEKCHVRSLRRVGKRQLFEQLVVLMHAHIFSGKLSLIVHDQKKWSVFRGREEKISCRICGREQMTNRNIQITSYRFGWMKCTGRRGPVEKGYTLRATLLA